jgi:hypothetical protein
VKQLLIHVFQIVIAAGEPLPQGKLQIHLERGIEFAGEPKRLESLRDYVLRYSQEQVLVRWQFDTQPHYALGATVEAAVGSLKLAPRPALNLVIVTGTEKSYYAPPPADVVVLSSSAVFAPDRASLLHHEIGHGLGLWHLGETWCNERGSSPEQYGVPARLEDISWGVLPEGCIHWGYGPSMMGDDRFFHVRPLALDQWQLGWLPPGTVEVVADLPEPRTVRLVDQGREGTRLVLVQRPRTNTGPVPGGGFGPRVLWWDWHEPGGRGPTQHNMVGAMAGLVCQRVDRCPREYLSGLSIGSMGVLTPKAMPTVGWRVANKASDIVASLEAMAVDYTWGDVKLWTLAQYCAEHSDRVCE